jgi:hypothetical protein
LEFFDNTLYQDKSCILIEIKRPAFESDGLFIDGRQRMRMGDIIAILQNFSRQSDAFPDGKSGGFIDDSAGNPIAYGSKIFEDKKCHKQGDDDDNSQRTIRDAFLFLKIVLQIVLDDIHRNNEMIKAR